MAHRDQSEAGRKSWRTRRENEERRVHRQALVALGQAPPDQPTVPNPNFVATGEIVHHTCGHTFELRVNKYWSNAYRRESAECARESLCRTCFDARYGYRTEEGEEELRTIKEFAEHLTAREAAALVLDVESFMKARGVWDETEAPPPVAVELFRKVGRLALAIRRIRPYPGL